VSRLVTDRYRSVFFTQVGAVADDFKYRIDHHGGTQV